MKKLILSLLVTLLMSTATISAQSNQVTNKVVDKASAGIEKVYTDGTTIVNTAYNAAKAIEPKLEKALGVIGTSLKVGADHVWDILIRQQLVWSICFLMITLTAIAAWAHVYYRFERGSREVLVTKEYSHSAGREGWKTANEVIFGFSLAIAFILSSLSIYNFSDMMTGFINPEFGAMKTIAEIAQQIK